MAMIWDVCMSILSKGRTLLADFVGEEVAMLLGVESELEKLIDKMESIKCLLQDAEKRRFDDSSTELWLSKLKDVMYDADDIIDLCIIKRPQLLADQNPESKTSPVCCNFSFLFDCFTGVPLLHEIGNRFKKNYDSLDITGIPLRHDIGNRIKEINDRLDQIYKNRVRYNPEISTQSETSRYKLEISTNPETRRITPVDSSQTYSMLDPLVVGTEVDDAANMMVHRLVTENVEEKCRLFAVTGMGRIGKTTLAQKIINHETIKVKFNLKIWICVSQRYSEIELLRIIITEANKQQGKDKPNGNYGHANTKEQLIPRLRDVVASGGSLFLVLDDVWREDVWVDLLRVPLCNAKTIVRVLVTTRDETVARGMDATPPIHHVEQLSTKSGWDMLRSFVFHKEDEEQANEYEDLRFKIVKKCGHLPLAIKAVAGVLKKKRITKKAWKEILSNKAWSIGKLPDELRGALYLSFEDLPSHLKQCFLYLSLYPEDASILGDEVVRYWVAEGFITEPEENSILEDVAEKYINELVERNLLQPLAFSSSCTEYKMHDLIRSLVLFLSEEESSFGNENVKNAATSTKLRRLSVADKSVPSAQILNLIANQGGLRTLLASHSYLLLDSERLRQLSRLRILDISSTEIVILPYSIGNLVQLRYLDLSATNITEIPESIEHLACLQFLIIRDCKKLTQLPSGIIKLGNLRCLDLYGTRISFIPKGIGTLNQLNKLTGFVVANNDSSSQLEELNSLNQIRILWIEKLEGAKSGANILGELSYLSKLTLDFTDNTSEQNVEDQLAAEKLFDELKPPPSLEELYVFNFFGSRFPYWMALSTFESCVPLLTKLSLDSITLCTQLPPLGQMPELRELEIINVGVEIIGPEFLGGGAISTVNSSPRIAFPKLQRLKIGAMFELKEWSFGAKVEENASPSLKLLPCFHELYIGGCPLLKWLPKGLKNSTMKRLYIIEANRLESLDDLPALKYLHFYQCGALSCVGNFDSLQHLVYSDIFKESLPEWLLMLLQQQRLQNDSNKNFKFELLGSSKVSQECLKGGSYWEDLIQHIPQVTIKCIRQQTYLRYNKQLNVYDTNLRLI